MMRIPVQRVEALIEEAESEMVVHIAGAAGRMLDVPPPALPDRPVPSSSGPRREQADRYDDGDAGPVTARAARAAVSSGVSSEPCRDQRAADPDSRQPDNQSLVWDTLPGRGSFVSMSVRPALRASVPGNAVRESLKPPLDRLAPSTRRIIPAMDSVSVAGRERRRENRLQERSRTTVAAGQYPGPADRGASGTRPGRTELHGGHGEARAARSA